MSQVFRKGGVGAMMDEYERSASELRSLLENVSIEAFEKIVDPNTSDENCRSIQTIVSHVVGAGYSYSDYIRACYSIPSARPARRLLSCNESIPELDAMLAYTVQTLDGKWEISEEEITKQVIYSSWNVTYDLEQLMEHAIVHILRHRRQVERFLQLTPGR